MSCTPPLKSSVVAHEKDCGMARKRGKGGNRTPAQIQKALYAALADCTDAPPADRERRLGVARRLMDDLARAEARVAALHAEPPPRKDAWKIGR